MCARVYVPQEQYYFSSVNFGDLILLFSCIRSTKRQLRFSVYKRIFHEKQKLRQKQTFLSFSTKRKVPKTISSSVVKFREPTLTLLVWGPLHHTRQIIFLRIYTSSLFFVLLLEIWRKCSFLISHFEIDAKQAIVNKIIRFLFLKPAWTISHVITEWICNLKWN